MYINYILHLIFAVRASVATDKWRETGRSLCAVLRCPSAAWTTVIDRWSLASGNFTQGWVDTYYYHLSGKNKKYIDLWLLIY